MVSEDGITIKSKTLQQSYLNSELWANLNTKLLLYRSGVSRSTSKQLCNVIDHFWQEHNIFTYKIQKMIHLKTPKWIHSNWVSDLNRSVENYPDTGITNMTYLGGNNSLWFFNWLSIKDLQLWQCCQNKFPIVGKIWAGIAHQVEVC